LCCPPRPGCGLGRAAHQWLLSQLYLGCCWDVMHMPFCLLLSQHTVFGRFSTIYSDPWLFIADWLMLDLEVKGGARRVKSSWRQSSCLCKVRVCILSPCLWDLPDFPAVPGWEGCELCTGIEGKGWGRAAVERAGIVSGPQDPSMAQRHTSSSLARPLPRTCQLVVHSQL